MFRYRRSMIWVIYLHKRWIPQLFQVFIDFCYARIEYSNYWLFLYKFYIQFSIHIDCVDFPVIYFPLKNTKMYTTFSIISQRKEKKENLSHWNFLGRQCSIRNSVSRCSWFSLWSKYRLDQAISRSRWIKETFGNFSFQRISL